MLLTLKNWLKSNCDEFGESFGSVGEFSDELDSFVSRLPFLSVTLMAAIMKYIKELNLLTNVK